MKNTRAAVCVLFVLSALLAGCPIDVPAKAKKHVDLKGFIPDDIVEHTLSALPAADQTEVARLYGCYWPSGEKKQCAQIGAGTLVSYSTAMSYSYTNLRWSKLSPSVWVCCSYYKDNTEYDPADRKVIFKFTKSAGSTWTLEQYVVPMGTQAGPLAVGKNVEKLAGGGKDGADCYVYDKNDAASPKMLAPKPL